MAFTACEMIVAISNSTVDSYLEDRYERASFASFLASEYGTTDSFTAQETLNWLKDSDVWYEDGVVSYLYRDLMQYREQAADELENTER